MSEIEVPLRPLGREDIQKLEAVLLLGTVSSMMLLRKCAAPTPKTA